MGGGRNEKATASGTSAVNFAFRFATIDFASRFEAVRSLHGLKLTKKKPWYVAEVRVSRLKPPIVVYTCTPSVLSRIFSIVFNTSSVLASDAAGGSWTCKS